MLSRINDPPLSPNMTRWPRNGVQYGNVSGRGAFRNLLGMDVELKRVIRYVNTKGVAKRPMINTLQSQSCNADTSNSVIDLVVSHMVQKLLPFLAGCAAITNWSSSDQAEI